MGERASGSVKVRRSHSAIPVSRAEELKEVRVDRAVTENSTTENAMHRRPTV